VPIDILEDAKALAKRKAVPLDDVVSAALRLLLIQSEPGSSHDEACDCEACDERNGISTWADDYDAPTEGPEDPS